MIRSDREYRNIGTFALNGDNDSMVEGYASTFERYLLGRFNDVDYFERIDPHAFDECDLSDVIFLRDHEGRVLARTRNRSVTLWVDDKGLANRTDLSLTEASRAMLEDIKVGNYTQMSFSFKVAEGGDFLDSDNTRVITRIKKVYDISAVAFPANPTTGIGISARDALNGVIEARKTAERLKRQKELRIRTLLSRTGQI